MRTRLAWRLSSLCWASAFLAAHSAAVHQRAEPPAEHLHRRVVQNDQVASCRRRHTDIPEALRRGLVDAPTAPFCLHQRGEFLPEQQGAATRLRLSIDTRAHGPIRMIVPLLRGRFRKTMTQSLRTIAAMLEQQPP